MSRGRAVSTVDWRKYLDVNVNPRAKTFLESRGADVLWQIASNIDNSITGTKSTKRLIMSVHPNAPSAILINFEDYKDVLELCLNWFEKKEQYEVCQKILNIKNRLIPKKPKRVKKVFEKII